MVGTAVKLLEVIDIRESAQLHRSRQRTRVAVHELTGSAIGGCLPRHRHEGLLKFLRIIDREIPEPLQIHLILDQKLN
jgi:hypothetical protein